LNTLYISNQKLANHGGNGFYIRQPTKQKQNENSYKINQLHSHNINKRAFGDAITDIFGGLQNQYDNWISNSGGAGNLVQRIPAKFSSAEHLIYDDYQIIGPHFRCPPTKPAWMCFFYLIDAYKARKINKIPSQLRYIVGQAKTAVTMWKGILFSPNFMVKNALDVMLEFGRRVGIKVPEFKSENMKRTAPLIPTFAILENNPLQSIADQLGFGSTWGLHRGLMPSLGSVNVGNFASNMYDRVGKLFKWNTRLVLW